MPLFSIVIPTFNRRPFLQVCLEHLQAQSFPDFEIIVADNASTDDTPNYLSQIQDKRIKFIRHPQNRGAFQNLLFCSTLGSGSYLLIHQDDCVLHRDFLARCHECVSLNADVAVFGSVMASGNAQRGYIADITSNLAGSDNQLDDFPICDKPILIEGARVAVRYLFSHCINHPGIVFRRTALEAIGGYCNDLNCYADLVTVPRMMSKGRVAYDPRVGALSLIHSSNVSTSITKSNRAKFTHNTFCHQVKDLSAWVPDWPERLQEELKPVNVKTLHVIMKDSIGFRAPMQLTRVFYQKYVVSYPKPAKRLKTFLSHIGVKNTVRLFWRLSFS